MRFFNLLILFPFFAQAQRIEAESFASSLGVNIYPNPDDGLCAGSIDNGDWMDYNNAVAGASTIAFRVATINSNAKFQIKQGSLLLATVAVPNTFGWYKWTTVTASISLSAGKLRIQSIGDGWNLDWIEIALMSPPPTANAGSDTIVMFPARGYLIGTATGTGITKKWSLISVIAPEVQDSVSFFPVDSTVFTYRLTVTDKQGRVASDDVRVLFRYDPYGSFLRFQLIPQRKEFFEIFNNGQIAIGGFSELK